MARKSTNLEFGNLNCKFGEYELLDLAEGVIIPAFFDTDLERNFTNTRYFFHRVELVTIENGDEPILAIAGRLVKESELSSRQYYSREQRTLLSQDVTIPNAPTGFFVLILNNHRVIYLRETSDAPLLSTFGTTAEIFIRRKLNEYIELQHRQRNAVEEKKLSKASIRADFNPVDINFIPLSSEEAIEELLDEFRIIQSIHLSFVTPNGVNFKGFIGDKIDEKQALKAERYTTTAGNPEGLERDAAEGVITETLKTENVNVKFRGISNNDEKLTGDNDKVKLSVEYPKDTLGVESITTLAKSLYDFSRDYILPTPTNEPDRNRIQERLLMIQRRQVELNRRSREGHPPN